MDIEKLQKKRNFWFGFAMMLMGIVIGYLIAPAKNGVNVKNICGNDFLPKNYDDEDYDDEEYQENSDELKF